MITLITAFFGGLLNRIDGGLFKVSNAGLIAALGMTTIPFYFTNNAWLCVAFAITLLLGNLLGHGSWTDLGRVETKQYNEELDEVAHALGIPVGGYWYEFLMLGVHSFCITFLPAAILIMTGKWSACFFLVVTTLAKPIAYEIGWRIPLKIKGFTQGPEIGEFVFGAIRMVALLYVFL